MSALQFCSFCRRVTRHAVLQGATPAPSFDLCQVCGQTYRVIEPSTEEAS